MKTKMILMTMVLGLVSAAAPAFAIEDAKVLAHLKKEAAKDMAGKPSCFKGEIKKKDAEMQESYGGRYQQGGEVPNLNLVKIGEENSRYFDKYCDQRFDKNKKLISEDDEKTEVVYRRCHFSEESVFAVSAGYEFSTSGSYGTEPALFQVIAETTTQYLIDDRLDMEKDGYAKALSQETKMTCQPITTPELPEE